MAEIFMEIVKQQDMDEVRAEAIAQHRIVHSN